MCRTRHGFGRVRSLSKKSEKLFRDGTSGRQTPLRVYVYRLCSRCVARVSHSKLKAFAPALESVQLLTRTGEQDAIKRSQWIIAGAGHTRQSGRVFPCFQ